MGRAAAAIPFFLLLRRPVGKGLAIGLGFKGGVLSPAGGGEVELGLLAQTLKIVARGEEGLDNPDVIYGERILGLSTGAGEGEPDVTEMTEADLAAVQQALADTTGNSDEHGHHIFLVILGVVIGYVLGEMGEIIDLSNLSPGIGLLGFLGLHGIRHHGNGIVNHRWIRLRSGTFFERTKILLFAESKMTMNDFR